MSDVCKVLTGLHGFVQKMCQSTPTGTRRCLATHFGVFLLWVFHATYQVDNDIHLLGDNFQNCWGVGAIGLQVRNTRIGKLISPVRETVKICALLTLLNKVRVTSRPM